jgi:hypothetical protein
MNRPISTRSESCRILIFAMLACGFALCGQAQALSLKSTAHCRGTIQDTSGNVIVDLGTVAAYTALFPQDGAYQAKCIAAVSAAASAWLSNSGQMCHAFLAADGSNLIFFYSLGSLPSRDSGHATEASSYNYPLSCFNLSGTVFPSYYIFTLIYTPPGCTLPPPSPSQYKCGAGSFVSYSSGSTAGSTVSIANSTGTSTSLTATLGGLGVGGSFSETSTSGSSVTVSKATSAVFTWPNPAPVGNDGINHDFDQFEILVNPAVAMTGWHDPVTQQNHAQWSLGTRHGEAERLQRVQVSYLRCALAGIGPRPGGSSSTCTPLPYDRTGSCSSNPFLQMPGPPDASSPSGWLPGLTCDDYQQMLDQDLFWNASNTPVLIPTSRFAQMSMDFTYDQPGGQFGTSCMPLTQSLTTSDVDTATSSQKTQYKASMTLSANFPIDTNQLDLRSTTSLTWTDSNSTSLSNTSTQTASATVACSSMSWTGPDNIAVYYDTMYGTFLFALDDGTGYAMLLQGTITDTDGDLVPHEPLKLVVGGKVYQTFSHNNGTFRFHLPAGQTSSDDTTGTLIVGNADPLTQTVSVGPAAMTTVEIPTPVPSLSVALIHDLPPPARPIVPLSTPDDARAATPMVLLPTPLLVAVTNQSAFAVAKHVTITSIEAKTSTGAPIAYTGSLPVIVPGGAALLAGSTARLPLTFASFGAMPAFLTVTVSADNLPPFSTVLLPAGQ